MTDLPVLTHQDFLALASRGEVVENVDLAEIDWDDLPETALRFKGCRLSEKRLVEACLEEAAFENCCFVNVAFPRGNLREAVFTGCSFFDPEAGTGCDFSHANLEEAAFRRCNLATSLFKNASLKGAVFEECKAHGCNFKNARFSRTVGRVGHSLTAVHMLRSNFDFAQMAELTFDDCSLLGSSFREADFYGCSFIGADLSDSDLTGAQLDRCNFENADLRGASMDRFDFAEMVSIDGLKINHSQQSVLLAGLGIRVFPD